MNNIGIVVENLDNAISFFSEIGLKIEGRGIVEGEWAGRVTGLGDQSVEVLSFRARSLCFSSKRLITSTKKIRPLKFPAKVILVWHDFLIEFYCDCCPCLFFTQVLRW